MKIEGIEFLASKYFQKMVGFGLLVGFLPILIVGIYAFNISSSATQDKVMQQNSQTLFQTRTYAEYILMSADTSLRHFAESSGAYEALKSNMEGTDFQILQNTVKSLSTIVSPQIWDSDTCLINYKNEWVLNNYGLYRLNTEDTKIYDEFRALAKPSLWQTRFSDENPPMQYGPFFRGNSVYLIKSIPLAFAKPESLGIIRIPCAYLNSLLQSNSGWGSMYILDENFRVVGDSHGNEVGEDWKNHDLVKNFLSTESPQEWFQLETEDGTEIVTYQHSNYNNWYYISIVPQSEILRDVRSIGFFTILIAVICFLSVFVVSILGSRRMYKPVFQIYQNLLKGSASEKDSDEFKYIGHRVSALLEGQIRLEDEMHWQFQQLKEFFSMKVILGNMSVNDLPEKLQLKESLSEHTCKCMFVIQIDSLQGTDYTENDKDILLFAINNIAEELWRGNYMLTPVIIPPSHVTIISVEMNENALCKVKFQQFAMDIQRVLYEHFGISISVGISRFFEDISCANTAYLEASEALKYRIRQGKNSILFFDSFHSESSITSFVYLQTKKQLIKAFLSGNEKMVTDLLDVFVKEIFSANLNPTEYQILIAGLLLEMIDIIYEKNFDYLINDTSNHSLFKQLFEMQTPEEIMNWFHCVIIEPFITVFKEENQRNTHRLAALLKEMIEKEYDQDLTIELCAQRLNYYPSYLRRVFVREYKINFGEYLTQYRIEIAKKWLRESDLRIFDIASRLQYSNSQNFIRSFKKITGITPGQYRECED